MPALQRGFERQHQILGPFVDLDLAVADDPEAPVLLQGEAGEQAVDEQRDHFLERNEPDAVAEQADEALDLRGNGNQRIPVLAVGAGEVQEHADAEVGNERERVRRIDGERGQNGKHVVDEPGFQPRPVVGRQLLSGHHPDPLPGKFGLKRRPDVPLLGHQSRPHLENRRHLLRRRQPVLARGGDPLLDLRLQAGDPDHVELVPVGPGDREKPKPLEQRVIRIGRLLENAAVEGQPRELAIDERRLALTVHAVRPRARFDRRLGIRHHRPPSPSVIHGKNTLAPCPGFQDPPRVPAGLSSPRCPAMIGARSAAWCRSGPPPLRSPSVDARCPSSQPVPSPKARIGRAPRSWKEADDEGAGRSRHDAVDPDRASARAVPRRSPRRPGMPFRPIGRGLSLPRGAARRPGVQIADRCQRTAPADGHRFGPGGAVRPVLRHLPSGAGSEGVRRCLHPDLEDLPGAARLCVRSILTSRRNRRSERREAHPSPRGLRATGPADGRFGRSGGF